MTIELSETGRRHRGPSQDYLLKRASLDVVGPVRRKLGVWQTRAVHLVALGQRLKAHGRQGPSYAAEAEALSVALEHERGWLASRIGRGCGPRRAPRHATLARRCGIDAVRGAIAARWRLLSLALTASP